MNILIRIGRFSGGAAKSALEYAKTFQQLGNEVMVIGQYKNMQDSFIKNGIKILNVRRYTIKSPYKNLQSLLHLKRIIRDFEPDLVFTFTGPYITFDLILSKIYKIPIVGVVPGGIIPPYMTKLVRNIKFIVFSEEIFKHFINQGYPSNLITVVTNRIDFKNSKENNKGFYKNINNKTINLTVISRLDKEKINSVKHILNVFQSVSHQLDYPLNLNLIGDGDQLKELKKYSNVENINFLGFKKNVEDYIVRSHIVFGKGRSVLESAYLERVSCVITENKSLHFINTDSYSELKTSNFTGRNINIKKKSEDILLAKIHQIRKSLIDEDELKQIKKNVIQDYDVAILGEIMRNFLNSFNFSRAKKNPKFQYLRVLTLYIWNYNKYIFYRIKYLN